MDQSKIFDAVYPDLLAQVKQIDLSGKMHILGIHKHNAVFGFNFFNRVIAFDGNDFFDTAGADLTPAVKVVLCTYILMCPEKEIKSIERHVTFREFSNAGPLFSTFTENTGKIIQTRFAGALEALRLRCLTLGGTIINSQFHDISVRFKALPRIPIILHFNDADDIMPANAGFLYVDTADSYLDLQCLTITCTYLTGLLLKDNE